MNQENKKEPYQKKIIRTMGIALIVFISMGMGFYFTLHFMEENRAEAGNYGTPLRFSPPPVDTSRSSAGSGANSQPDSRPEAQERKSPQRIRSSRPAPKAQARDVDRSEKARSAQALNKREETKLEDNELEKSKAVSAKTVTENSVAGKTEPEQTEEPEGELKARQGELKAEENSEQEKPEEEKSEQEEKQLAVPKKVYVFNTVALFPRPLEGVYAQWERVVNQGKKKS